MPQPVTESSTRECIEPRNVHPVVVRAVHLEMERVEIDAESAESPLRLLSCFMSLILSTVNERMLVSPREPRLVKGSYAVSLSRKSRTMRIPG